MGAIRHGDTPSGTGGEGGGGVLWPMTSSDLKFRKIIDVQSSWIVTDFSYVYLIVDWKRSLNIYEIS